MACVLLHALMSLVSCLHVSKICSIRLGSVYHEERETDGKVELEMQKHVSGIIDSFCLKTLHYCPCKLSRHHEANVSAHKLYYLNTIHIHFRKVFYFIFSVCMFNVCFRKYCSMSTLAYSRLEDAPAFCSKLIFSTKA